MKVLFLTSGDRVPSTRFRVLPFVDHLKQDGIQCTVASSIPQKYDHWPLIGFRASQKLKRLVRWWHLLLARIRNYDVVVIERELFDNSTIDMELRVRKIAKRIVLDVDDAIFLRHPEKTETLTRMADLVIAGNPQIEEVLSPWNDRCVIIPTGVQLASFPEKDRSVSDSDVPVVGWMGTRSNLAYFEVVAEALRNLSSRVDFELRLIVSDLEPLQSIDLTGVRIRHVEWQGETEVDELRKIDIGIMPLFSDREWDRYKCPTKMTQYMAVGIPGVASPVGFTADVVEHGVSGFLAASTAEWEQILERLIRDPDLRKTIGLAGREVVSQKYSVEANHSVLADALRQAAAL
jgi:glycosyltransferase involved in cell wall biosynthesis